MGMALRSSLLALFAVLLLLSIVRASDPTEHAEGKDALLAISNDDSTGARPPVGSNVAAAAAYAAAQSLPSTPEEPTCANGWRELGPDEPVRPGSHVQLNMATGKKHVKEPCVDQGMDQDVGEDAVSEEVRVEMMERVLYGLPEPDPQLPRSEERSRMSAEEYAAALDRVWKARQVEVQKAVEEMQDEGAGVLKDVKVIASADMGNSDPQSVLASLQELEHQVQDIDLALHFTKVGGLDACVALITQHVNPLVRELAAHVSGNAIKNHPQMQSTALQAGLIPAAVSRLQVLAPCRDTDSSSECGKMLYAITSATRGFVPAQQDVLETDLVPVVANMLADLGLEQRLLQKVFALITDSIMEWHVPVSTWTNNVTKVPLCDALSHRANVLRMSPTGQPGAVDVPPQVKALAIKLRQAVIAASCDTTVVDSSSLFQ